MKNDIKDKLGIELEKPIEGEPQVIYILSRIRKILDIDHKKNGRYRVLRFYCNWALHTEIEDTDAIKDLLHNMRDDIKASSDFSTFRLFDSEFQLFLKEYGFTTKIYNQVYNEVRFKKLLAQIYSDTPLILKTVRTKITAKYNDQTATDSLYMMSIEFSEEY